MLPTIWLSANKNGGPGRLIYEVNRRLITAMIEDVGTAARARIAALAPQSSDDIGTAGEVVVAFSEPFARELAALKAHLFEHVYRHERVMSVMRRAETLVVDLFGHFMRSEEGLSARWAAAVRGVDEGARAALIGDYVAGMTDRFAMDTHRAVLGGTGDLR